MTAIRPLCSGARKVVRRVAARAPSAALARVRRHRQAKACQELQAVSHDAQPSRQPRMQTTDADDARPTLDPHVLNDHVSCLEVPVQIACTVYCVLGFRGAFGIKQ